jgi:hypothetical protein
MKNNSENQINIKVTICDEGHLVQHNHSTGIELVSNIYTIIQSINKAQHDQ